MKFLLINPYICDFACYDYWMKPLGLLYLSSILKEKGHKVNLIDCMDRNHPYLPKSREKKFGRGKFYSKEREKPEILKKYPRKYKIYGLYGQKLYNLLKSMEKPDIVVMTSTMTYWYPGTKETADMVKDVYKDVPLILGGIYPSLCKDHARKTVKADYIFTGSGFEKLFSFIGESCPEFSEWPAPDYNFYKNLGYAVIRTSIGCHRNCSYCGIKNIYKGYESKKADTIGSEIEYLKNLYGIDNFVFYDDSLLENENLLEYLQSPLKGIKFHTPNGLEVNKIDKAKAKIMKKANFADPVLSADVINEKRMEESGKKLEKKDLINAVENMFSAGYKKGKISAYLILGMPNQSIEEIREAIQYLHKLGLKVKLAEYSVVPKTREEKKFPGNVIAEPLLHNNSIYPSFSLKEWENIYNVKRYAKRMNNEF